MNIPVPMQPRKVQKYRGLELSLGSASFNNLNNLSGNPLGVSPSTALNPMTPVMQMLTSPLCPPPSPEKKSTRRPNSGGGNGNFPHHHRGCPEKTNHNHPHRHSGSSQPSRPAEQASAVVGSDVLQSPIVSPLAQAIPSSVGMDSHLKRSYSAAAIHSPKKVRTSDFSSPVGVPPRSVNTTRNETMPPPPFRGGVVQKVLRLPSSASLLSSDSFTLACMEDVENDSRLMSAEIGSTSNQSFDVEQMVFQGDEEPAFDASPSSCTFCAQLPSCCDESPESYRRISDFREREKIGAGSFSTVYRVEGAMDGVSYALKRSSKPIKGHADRRQRLREVRFLSRLSAAIPGVVRYYDSWIEGNQLDGSADALVIRTELCAKGNVGDYLDTAWSDDAVADLLHQVATTLAHMHYLGVAHCDVKPSNILLAPALSRSAISSSSGWRWNSHRPEGATKSLHFPADSPSETSSDSLVSGPYVVQYKLADFGLARSIPGFDASPTPASNFLRTEDNDGNDSDDREGDAVYLPPERLLSQHRNLPESDVFSLGLCALECMIAAPLPSEGEAYRALRQVSAEAGVFAIDELHRSDGAIVANWKSHGEGLCNFVSRMISSRVEERPEMKDVVFAFAEAPRQPFGNQLPPPRRFRP